MSDETRERHRIISASVRDRLDAYRIQAQAGPVSDQALEGIIFRAAHPVVDSLAPHPAGERAALLPSVVRLLLPSFLEGVAGADGTREGGTVTDRAPVAGPGGDGHGARAPDSRRRE